MTNKLVYTFVCICLFICIGCKDNKQKEFNIKMLDNDSKSYGGIQGFKDGNGGFAYKHGYDDRLIGFDNESRQDREEYQEHYSKGYKIGYDRGYKEGKALYDKNHRVEQVRENSSSQYEEPATIQSSPNTHYTAETYSPPVLEKYAFHSNEKINGNYYEYEETNNCEEGVVVYEGNGGYYIVETRKGYTVIEDYSGSLYESAKLRGELNKYYFKYVINRNGNKEIKVYVEDYMLSDEKAITILGEKKGLKPKDQRAYDELRNH